MKHKYLFLITLCLTFAFITYANLPCQDGSCPSGCPCKGQGTGPGPGQGPGKGGSAGSGPGRGGPPPVTLMTSNKSVDLEIQFGRPATENLSIDAKFSVYTAKPTPTLYSPQMLQYINPLLNRISQNVISQTYKDSIGLSFATSVNTATYAATAAENSAVTTSLIFRGGYSENELSNSLPSGVTHQTRMIGPNREALLFNFTDGNSSAKMTGDTAYLGYQLQMVNQTGEPVTSNPYYYDMYIGYGNFVRYLVSSGYPVSYHTASGRVLKPSEPSVGLDAVYDADGIIRQVWSFADGLADIVVTESLVSYEIRFYPPSQVGNKVDGVYQTSGEPYMVVRIENPNPTTNTEVAITKIIGGVSYQTLFRYSHGSEGWIMYSPGNLSVNSRSTVYDYSNTVRTVSAVIKTSDGKIAKKSTEVYQKFNFGERIVATTLDPDGQTLRSSYTYYTDSANNGSYGRVATENLADGSWRTYSYNADGWETKIISPWLNSALNSPAAESQELSFSYNPNDNRDVITLEDKRPRLLETKILGKTVKKIFQAYYFENNTYTEIQEEATVPSAIWGDETNLKTVWKYYPKGDCTSASAGRIQQITYPNQTMESYTYEYGNLQQDAATRNYTFIPGNGNALRVYITKGTISSPAGIAYKSTREELFYDARGNQVYSGTQIYTGNGYETADWVRHGYDEQHRVLSELKSNGELTETTWNCCQKMSETLPDGIQYLYTYDVMQRLISKTKVGIGSQPDLVTTYQYNAADQIIAETITGGELSESSSREYNFAGLLTKKTDKTGLFTTFSYLNAINTGSNRRGLIVTTILPGDFTQIYSQYCDGQQESLTGDAQMPIYFRYGVNDNGSVWEQELMGGGDSPRRKTMTMGMNGNLLSSVTSGYGGDIIEHFSYNARNQISKITKTGSAPVLLEYDSIGNLSRVGLDVDGDCILAVESNDRILDLGNAYFSDDGWWKVLTKKTYGTIGSSVATVFSVEKERLSGFTSGVSEERRQQDIHGNTTVFSTSFDQVTKRRIESIQEPNSTVAAQKEVINGLLHSERTMDNLTTMYGYDSLERMIAVTEPRIGTTTISYYTSEGKRGLPSSLIDAAGNMTAFDFDSAGRLAWRKNALGKYTRFSYNSYGQPARIWGDAQYPLEFAYDDYGRQTAMRTYRTGNNWSNVKWPGSSVTGDLTTWTYDDASGLVIAKTDAANHSVHYTYTVDGKLASRTWARGLSTAYSYDAATGKLLSVDYSDTTPDISYTYNRIGQLATVQDAAGTRVFTYNETFDRIGENIAGLYSKVLTYHYAASGVKGRYQGFALDNVSNSDYSYDSYGRLNKINGFGGAFQYTRLADSELIEKLIRPNGVNSTWSYEAHRNIVTQLVNGQISTFRYINDALGRRTSMSRSGSTFAVPDVITYGYNDRNEIISALSNVNESYNYNYDFDPIGNRQTATITGNSWGYTSNNLNQYTMVMSRNNMQSPTYDSDGNMLARDGWNQSWNCENRLIETEKNNIKLLFTYDYMGRRISKKVYENDVLVKHLLFVYDDYKLIEELDALNDNATLRRYCWQSAELGMDVPLSVYDAMKNATYFYMTDANKNVSNLTDSVGAVLAHYEYTPFGVQSATIGTYAAINPFRFSSEYFDSETGLVYYNYRYYAPSLGRWLSRDPIAELGGWNLYGMVKNNPINEWDNYGQGIGNVVNKADKILTQKERSKKIDGYQKRMKEVNDEIAKAQQALNECLSQHECRACGTTASRTQGLKTSSDCTHVCQAEQAALASARARRNVVLTDMAADGIEEAALSTTGAGGTIVGWYNRVKDWLGF